MKKYPGVRIKKKKNVFEILLATHMAKSMELTLPKIVKYFLIESDIN